MFRVSGPAGEFKVVVYNEDLSVKEVLQPFKSIVAAKAAIIKLSYKPFRATVLPLDG